MDDMQQILQSVSAMYFFHRNPFNDRITGDSNEFAPNAKIVHVDIDTASISRNVVVDVPIVADAKLAIQRLLEWAEPQKTEKWRACIAQWKKKIRYRCEETVD